MAITIPADDIEGTKLQGNVNNTQTLINNNPNNLALLTQLAAAQLALDVYLLNNGSIVPSAVIANEVFVPVVGDAPQ